MTAQPDTTVIATYRVKADQEAAFQDLLRKHFPVLQRHNLVTDAPPMIYRGEEQNGAPVYYEIFTWASSDSPTKAHETPDVADVWNAMGELVEDRDGRPKYEFPHVAQIEIELAEA